MLAVNHITFGTTLILSYSVFFDRPFFIPFIAFVVVGSLIPDVDHSGSKISNFLPAIGHFLKHRGPTHSILGIAIFYFLLYFLLGFNKTITIIFGFFALIGIILIQQSINKNLHKFRKFSGGSLSRKEMNKFINLISGISLGVIALTVFLVWQGDFRAEVLFLLAFGFTAHIAGDFLTKEGVPLFWPGKKRLGLKLFATGSTAEKIIGFLLFVANAFLLYLFITKFNLDGTEYWNRYLDFSPPETQLF